MIDDGNRTKVYGMHFSAFAQVLLVFAGITAPVAADLWLRGTHRQPVDPVWSVNGGNAERGSRAIVRYGCGSCHVIPGIGRADGRVGPRLNGLVEQVYLAGILTNDADNLVMWIRHPQEIDPKSAMPNLGVSEADARDMAAYLYSQ